QLRLVTRHGRQTARQARGTDPPLRSLDGGVGRDHSFTVQPDLYYGRRARHAMAAGSSGDVVANTAVLYLLPSGRLSVHRCETRSGAFGRRPSRQGRSSVNRRRAVLEWGVAVVARIRIGLAAVHTHQTCLVCVSRAVLCGGVVTVASAALGHPV